MKPMELEGSLKAFKFPEILQFLAMGRMTGVLSLSEGPRQVQLVVNEGKIRGSASKDRYLRLGQMLVYAGKISRKSLDEALEAQESGEPGKLLGEILVQKQVVTPEELRGVVRLQVEEEIWDLFMWESGNFRFEQGPVGRTGELDLSLDVEPLLLEGSRRLDEWQTILSNIDNPDGIYQVNPELAGAPDMTLDANTWRILSLVDGKLSVDAITRLSNLGKFETYASLDHLLRSELIVPACGPAEGELEPPAGFRLAAVNPAPFPPSRKEAASSESAEGEGTLGMLTGLFGRKKNSTQTTRSSADAGASAPAEPAGDYFTDVGLVCAALNHLLDCVSGETPHPSGSQAPDMMKSVWAEARQRCPKADLIKCKAGRLSPEAFEEYVRSEGGLSKALAGAHDESLEALGLVWKSILDRVGGRDSEQVIERALRPYVNAAARVQAPDFSLARWRRETSK